MTDPFSETSYKRNFIKEVIVRIDLVNPLLRVDTGLPPALTEAALRTFPIAEPREAVHREVEIGPAGVAHREDRYTEWHFHGKDREKTLTIGPKAILVQNRKYESYEVLRAEFMNVLDRFLDLFEGVQPARVGLRYVNVIELTEQQPLDWKAYLDPRLLSLFTFPPDSDRIALSRVFHNMELSFDLFNLRYLLGMHNPDYPARIRRKVFTLDLDAYTQAFVEPREIGRTLDSFHQAIQRYFEQSITQNLRGLMNAN